MYAVSASRTMRNAKPYVPPAPDPQERRIVLRPRELVDPKVVEDLAAERQQEAERERAAQVQLVLDATIAKYRLAHQQIAWRRTAKDIARDIAKENGMDIGLVLGRSRKKSVVAVRYKCIRAVADARPDLSTLRLGQIFNRDHTSILWALKQTRQPGAAR